MTQAITAQQPYGTIYCAACDTELRGTASDAADDRSPCCGTEIKETEYWVVGSHRDGTQHGDCVGLSVIESKSEPPDTRGECHSMWDETWPVRRATIGDMRRHGYVTIDGEWREIAT